MATVFLVFGGYVSYLRAEKLERVNALQVVEELVTVVEGNAAIAAYLRDIQLATEIAQGLEASRYISHVTVDIEGNDSIRIGRERPDGAPDVFRPLPSPFSGAEVVGTIRVQADLAYIAELAAVGGRSVVGSQLAQLALVSLVTLWLVRRVVTRPLNSVVRQLKRIGLSGTEYLRGISSRSDDEIGYLAKNINSMLHTIHDAYLTEAEKNRHIAQLERKFRLIFEGSHAGIVLVDEHNQLALSNSAFEGMVDHLVERNPNGEGCSLTQYFRDPQRVEKVLDTVRRNRASAFCDLMLAGHQDVWVRGVFSMIQNQDDEEKEYVEVVFYDISDRALVEKHFEYGATHDQLTGLLNRRGGMGRFEQQIEKACAKGMGFMLCLIDLNDFKPVNDIYGHEAGDLVLKEVAQRLRDALRPDDVVVRWGGDEFVVSLLTTSAQAEDTIGRNLLAVFVESLEIKPGVRVQVGASIGIATSEGVGFDIERIIEAADVAMYEVKRGDKNSYRVFEDAI
ncbi:MAG: diguanylate cyclase [Oceanospirillales bacterium]|nr:diguanylate cyclase [Oceanospirillales bacterium]